MQDTPPDRPDVRTDASPADASETSPRAPAMVIGYVFQGIGVVMFFAACCFWSMSTHIVPKADRPAGRWMDFLSGDDLPTALLTLGVVTTVIGGLGLVGVGVGLQGERAGAGPAAVIVTLLMAVAYWVVTVSLGVKVGPGAAVVPGAFALTATILFFLAAHAASLLRRYPAPPDQNVVTDAMLREMQVRRRREHNPDAD